MSFPHNKTTQKQKVDGTYSAELQAQTELPGLGQAAAPHTSGGWLDTTRCRIQGQRRRGRRLDAVVGTQEAVCSGRWELGTHGAPK
jgi:hypothetical protein